MTPQVAVVLLVEVEMRLSATRAVKKATTLESATNTTVASEDLAHGSTGAAIVITGVMEEVDALQAIQAEDLARLLLQDTAKVFEIAATLQTAEITTTAMNDAAHLAEESAAGLRKKSATITKTVPVSMAERTERLGLFHVNRSLNL